MILASSKIRGAIWYSAVASGEFLPTKVNIDTNMLPQQVVTKKHPTMEKKWLHYCSYHCRSYDLSFQKLNFDLLCSKILLLTEFFTLLLHQLEVHSTSYFCKSSIASCCTSSLWGFFRLLAGRDAKIGCSLLLEDLCFQNEMGAS